MPENLHKSFVRQGYVMLRGVLSQEEVAEIRASLPAHFEKLTRKPKRYLQARECLEIPQIYRLMAHPRIVEACRQIFGSSLVYVNDLVVQRNVLPTMEDTPHLDCQAEYRFLDRCDHLLDPKFLFAKIGIYLQDNTAETGGGIDVYEGGHRLVGNGIYFRYRIYKRWLRPFMARHMTRMDTKAGDVLIFDCRLPHRSTFARGLCLADYTQSPDGTIDVPEEKAKYTVYWEVTRRGDEVHFIANAKERAEKEEMSRPLDFYRPRCSYLGLVYPDDYPPSLVESLNDRKVTIFSLDRGEADHWLSAFHGQGEAKRS